MDTRLLLQDGVVMVAFVAAIYLYHAMLVRKLSGKMDTMKVRKVSRRFLVGSSVLVLCLMGSGVLFQAGAVQGIGAYALIGTIGVALFICLQVFNRLMR